MIPIDAPSADDAAIGVASQMGLEITGHVTTTDFRDPKSSREYQYIRHLEGEADQYVYMKIEPTVVIKVAAQGSSRSALLVK
jgi:hypothetical protein